MTDGNSLTLNELCRDGQIKLSDVTDNAINEGLYLFEAVFGVGRAWLAISGNEVADPVKSKQYLSLIRRRISGEPLQYLLGQWEFMGLSFKVGGGVLIPRPETEELAELVLNFLRRYENPSLLDLCAGSGCIAVSAAHFCPKSQVWGLELSETAYKFFTENIMENNTKNVTPIKGDVFDLPHEITARRYHAVVSNPPYIASRELASLQTEVQHEPTMALDGGKDGLDFYRTIPIAASRLLIDGGLLAMEIGNEQGEAVAELTRLAGFAEVQVIKDLSGNDRIVTGRYNLPTA